MAYSEKFKERNKAEIIGKVFNRIQVLNAYYSSDKVGLQINGVCECGKTVDVAASCVKSGNTKSCGCLNIGAIKNRTTTHGLSSNVLYSRWWRMIDRCTNPKNSKFKDYGGRGITVCERWLRVENFIEDMFPTFMEGLEIDRIDNNSGYSPENCKWSTRSEQNLNRRISGKVPYRGVSIKSGRPNGKIYRAAIRVSGKAIDIGYFLTPVEAAMAYDNYVKAHKLPNFLNFV